MVKTGKHSYLGPLCSVTNLFFVIVVWLLLFVFFYTEKAFKEALKTSAGTCGRVGENKTGIERRKTTTKALQPWRSMS